MYLLGKGRPKYVTFGRDVERTTYFDIRVFRTSFYVPTSMKRDSYVQFGRDVDEMSLLRPQRIMTSGKRSYGPKQRPPLKVLGRLAE